uniref:Uncharacterized protein n=1 Tax=Oryza glumipatula TaxID=40148 RepID=A0A0D9YW08_9ORYZ
MCSLTFRIKQVTASFIAVGFYFQFNEPMILFLHQDNSGGGGGPLEQEFRTDAWPLLVHASLYIYTFTVPSAIVVQALLQLSMCTFEKVCFIHGFPFIWVDSVGLQSEHKLYLKAEREKEDQGLEGWIQALDRTCCNVA